MIITIVFLMNLYCHNGDDCLSYMNACTFNPEMVNPAYNGDYMERFSDCRKWWKEQL